MGIIGTLLYKILKIQKNGELILIESELGGPATCRTGMALAVPLSNLWET